jgi:hypothetical protein
MTEPSGKLNLNANLIRKNMATSVANDRKFSSVKRSIPVYIVLKKSTDGKEGRLN